MEKPTRGGGKTYTFPQGTVNRATHQQVVRLAAMLDKVHVRKKLVPQSNCCKEQ